MTAAPSPTRTRRSCGSSARSGCCCAGRGPSRPAWPGELHPDLDGAAYGLLSLLQDAGPLRASDLVARLGLDKSTVSRQLAHLVDLGLVDRAADPVDGRAQVLTPSAEGSARLARIRDVRRARWENDLSDWPPSDVATLADLLAPAQPASVRRARPRPGPTPPLPDAGPPVRRGDTPRRQNVVDSNQLVVWLHSASIRRSEDSHAHHSRDPGPADVERRPAGPHRPARQRPRGRPALRRAAVLRLGAARPARARRRPALQRARRARPASTSRWPAGSSPSSSGSATSSAGPTRRTAAPACSASRPPEPTRSPRPAPCVPTGRSSALADWDEADARLLTDLLDRLVADLETAGAAGRPPPEPPMTSTPR